MFSTSSSQNVGELPIRRHDTPPLGHQRIVYGLYIRPWSRALRRDEYR